MIQTYKDLKGRTWDQPGIPKWIFRAGNDSLENLHPEIAQIYTTQLENNPDYELFYFSKEDRLQFIIDQNNDDLLYAYNTIIPEAFKTDIFRYVVLDVYGGVYMDFSMQTLVPFADIIKHYTYVYVKDTAGDHPECEGLYTAFIITPKENAFLKSAIKKSIYNIKHRIYGKTCLTVTSPHMLGEVYKTFHSLNNILIGPIGNDTVVYEHRLPNKFIEDGDINLVQIKHPKHYEILYSTGDRYDKVWEEGRMFKSERIYTYKDLKQRGHWQEDNVPRWIFRLGNEPLEDLHPDIINLYNVQLEINTDYELFYFSKEDRDEFIKDLNQVHVTTTYEKLVPPTYKCDLFKYLLMYNYGGVYFDFSMQSLIPLKTLIYTFKEVLAKDFGSQEGLCSGFMASIKGTSLMEGAIERCISNVRYNLMCEEPLNVTGPSMFGAIYRRKIGSDFITTGNLGDVFVYEFKDPDYIYDGDVPVIKIRIPNHYSLLYKPGDDDLYYAKLWKEKRIYKTNNIKTFKDLKDRKWEGEGIPKWIFKTGPFKVEDLPQLMREIYLDILAKNPGYELFYFSNEDCMLSIHHHYGEECFRLHQKLIPTAYQADLWRYLILNTYGGCYGDFSQIPLVSYNELTEGVDRVFVRDDPSNKSFLYNAVMCAKAGDDVVTRAIEMSINNILSNNYGTGTLDVTGPAVLGNAFLQKKRNLNPRSKEISLGDYNGSRILQHRYSGGFVCDKDGKNVFITKLANHNGFVYGNNHGTLHYDQAWREGRVFRS
jgi:mannosyltransferase OCH1-like enzyme